MPQPALPSQPDHANQTFRRLSGRLRMRHLVLLCHIREHGSLTRVAEHMATSQPAVTQSLAEIEDMFGTRLFRRTSRGMVATRYGQVVLDRAETILNDLHLLTNDLDAVARGKVGHLHIGAISSVSDVQLAKAIQRTTQYQDGITVTVQHAPGRNLLDMLRNHALDVVVARLSDTVDMAGLDHIVLYHQSPRLVASRVTAGQLGRRRLEWARLRDMDWILGPRHTALRTHIDTIFMNEGLPPPEPTAECHSPHLIGQLVAGNNHAVSIVPADIAEDLAHIAGLAIVPYSFDWHLPPIALFTRAGEAPRDTDQTFAAALRELCAPSAAPLRTAYGY